MLMLIKKQFLKPKQPIDYSLVDIKISNICQFKHSEDGLTYFSC